ncbi:hypothetical protein D3C76_1710660 [compost metagenome]
MVGYTTGKPGVRNPHRPIIELEEVIACLQQFRHQFSISGRPIHIRTPDRGRTMVSDVVTEPAPVISVQPHVPVSVVNPG